jgi:hypothetical protein
MSRVLTGAVLAGVTLLLLPVSTPAAPGPSVPCPVGEARSVSPDLAPGAERLVTAPFVIGCADLRHHGHLELVAYRLGRSLLSSALCVEIETRKGVSISCRDPADDLRGLEVGFSTVHRRRWLHFEGFASIHARQVRLRYRSLGQLRRSRGVLVRVDDSALLERLVVEPFGYFTAEASVRADRVLVLARNKAGKLIFRQSVPDIDEFLNPKNPETIGRLPLPRGSRY